MINELVLAASCIANNNISPVDGNPLFDIDKDFDGWKRQWIKDRMKKIYGDKANLPISEQEDKLSVATMHNSSTDAGQQKDPTDKTEGAIEILKDLCQLKHYKDEVGKDGFYEREQPLAWKRANEFLNSLLRST